MKAYKIVLFATVLLSSFSCSEKVDENESVYISKKMNSYTLEKVDSLVFTNSDSIFIGRTRDYSKWNDYILITDHIFNKLWVFDESLTLLKTLGGEGRGPGEFSFAPVILEVDTGIILCDFTSWRLSFYDHELNFVKTMPFNSERIIYPSKPIFIKNRFIFTGGGTTTIREELFDSYGSIVSFDMNFEFRDEFLEYDDYYKKRDAYVMYHLLTLLCKGSDNSFFAVQQAVSKIYHLNNEGNLIKKVLFKPLEFKIPPEKTFQEVSKSIESAGDFAAQTTQYYRMDYDSVYEQLFINYINVSKEFWIERDLLGGEQYLIGFDQNYNTILDEKIDGILAFVDNGRIYVLSEENPIEIKFTVYKTVIK